MATITVVYTGKANTFTISGVCLHPGANEVDADEWKLASASDFAKAKIKAGVFFVAPAQKAEQDFDAQKDPVPPSLGALKMPAALKAIEACSSVDQLERWLETDGRKPVREALVKRRYALAAERDEASEAEASSLSVRDDAGRES